MTRGPTRHVRAEGQAEAVRKKAAAYAQCNNAAVLEMLIGVLPDIAKEVAAPMGNIDKLTVISADGANELPKQVGSNVVQVLEMLKNTTGVDPQALAQRYTGSEEIATEAGGGALNGRSVAIPDERHGAPRRQRQPAATND